MRLRDMALAALAAAAVATGLSSATAGAAPSAGPGTNYAVDDVFTATRTQWWRDARFGQFIHFGPYSNLEGSYTRPDGTVCLGAEWIQRECGIPKDEYERLAKTFNPKDFNAEQIAGTAARAGQKYIVITSKHHDGYAMWPTKVNTWNLRNHSSFDPGRDILAELKAASDRHGVQFGVYYSIMDWHDPDFSNSATFPRYKARMFAQLKELVDNYHPRVLWFDGEWEAPWRAEDGEELEAYVRSLDPTIVINNRVGKRRVVDGDYGTPEQEIPAEPVKGQLWESCMTINNSWGFARHDTNWKSTTDLTRKLVSIAARGGNFLLNVGPDRNGAVPAPSIDRLTGMGQWLTANGQGAAVHGAGTPGLVAEPGWGAVSRKGDKLYASVFQWPGAGQSLTLAATSAFDVTGARVLGSTQQVTATRSGNTVTITPSAGAVNPIATVIELTVRTPAPAPDIRGSGLAAQFWPNATFTGSPTISRTDPGVNYNWKFTGSPAASIPAETFSARWAGRIVPRYSESYRFSAVSDDTVRLWINDQLVIDKTDPHEGRVDEGTIALTAGRPYSIRLEHTEQGGEAAMKLLWTSPNTPQQIVPANRLLPTAAPPGPTAGQTYTLRNVHSGKLASVSGAAVVQNPPTGGANEKWKATASGDGFSLAAVHSGQCADVTGAAVADGAKIIQWPCHGGANQTWWFNPAADGSYILRSANSGRCLDVPNWSTADNVQLIQWACHGDANQRWILTETT